MNKYFAIQATYVSVTSNNPSRFKLSLLNYHKKDLKRNVFHFLQSDKNCVIDGAIRVLREMIGADPICFAESFDGVILMYEYTDIDGINVLIK